METESIGLRSVRIIHNGGFEQAILEAVDKDGLLNDKDAARLDYLKTLNQNRVEAMDGTIIAVKK